MKTLLITIADLLIILAVALCGQEAWGQSYVTVEAYRDTVTVMAGDSTVRVAGRVSFATGSTLHCKRWHP